MNTLTTINNKLIPYSVNHSKRAKYLGITVYPDMRVVVTLPSGVSERKVEPFVERKAEWITRVLAEYEKFSGSNIIWGGVPEFRKQKDTALQTAYEKVTAFNHYYQFQFGKIFIKNYKGSWGACTEKRNLSFHYKIVHLPKRLLDYIIVHELCHVKEFNHSPAYWDLVTQQIPNHKALRKELRSFAI